MKYLIYLLPIFILQGCLYFNDRGVSGHLYDNCHSYYDANGNFIEKCDDNIIDYDEAQEGVGAIKDEITNAIISPISTTGQNSTSNQDGIDINELSNEDQSKLLDHNPELIKEEIELIESHCK